MSDLFLRSINFKDFRTFGDFEAQIVPGPGLTLLVGTNGLGKSSFFDALEWGLTGEVRRFKSYMRLADEGKYLTRRGATPGAHAVRLQFNNDGAAIARGPGAQPEAADVISLLKKPTWAAEVQDVATYLAFTHFLGQAAQQRFTSRDRDEQWASLRGPSGIDRLDDVRRGLRGRATEMAFNRRITRETKAIEDAERLLAEWRDLVTRAARLREAANSAGGIASDAFSLRLAELSVAVASVAPDFAVDAQSGATVQLAAIKAELERLRLEAASRRATLEALSDVPTRYAAEAAIADNGAVPLVDARAMAQREEVSLVSAAQNEKEARDNLQDLAATTAALEREINALESVRSDLDIMARVEPVLARLQSDRDGLNAALAQQRLNLTRLDTEIAAIQQRNANVAGLANAAKVASALADHARRLPDLRQRSEKSAAVLAGLDGAGARVRLAAALDDRSRLTTEIEIAKAAIEAAQDRASKVAAAVAAIASHLHDDDRTCPVCDTTFEQGQLRLLAEAAANAQDADLAQAERDHAELIRQLDQTAVRIAEVEATLRTVDEARRAADADALALTEVETYLRGLLPPGSVDLGGVALAVEKQAADDLAEAQVVGLGDDVRLAEAMATRGDLRASITEVETRFASLDTQIASLDDDRRNAYERLRAVGQTLASVNAVTVELNAARDRLTAFNVMRDAADEALRQAAEAEAAAQANYDRAKEALQRLETAQAAAANATRALATRWHNGAMQGTPSAEALQAALQSVGNLSRAVERFEDERSLLVAAVEVAARAQELTDLISQMNARGGEGAATAPEDHDATLVANVETARQALALTQTTHTAVEAFANKLREESRSFSTQFLTPLNDLIDDFNEALLSTPGETVQLNAAYHKDRTEFGMGLHYRDPLDDALYDTQLPPQVVLSEGQLAANGFSILCAASTAYPWSRWRALLMDDPLQHNDIIHAAAFVDLMRNLVELQRYQLIMSSHDRGEAEFIRRKFDAAGLPCTVINLTAPSKAGVRYLPPEHNGPARNALAAELAQSA